MEYVRGVDLMRVVERALFLPIDQVRIVMAQLILAVEHMHLKGFLHRDIKVSKSNVRWSLSSREFAERIRVHAGRACDWWSTGVVFYKLMTGRVPFRGKTKKVLRDRIIASPLKWPKVAAHPHSASMAAKDMVYLLLKKNPVERLGSKQYRDLKVKESADPISISESFMGASNESSSEIDYQKTTDADTSYGLTGFSKSDNLSRNRGATEKLDLILFRKKSFGCFWSFGVNLEAVTGEGGATFYMVKSVKRGSPAQMSQILVGDVVVAVNGKKLSGLPLKIVRKIMNSSGDQLVLTVLSSSPYRIINTRHALLQKKNGAFYCSTYRKFGRTETFVTAIRMFQNDAYTSA
ncbi:hypothetical protein HPB48_003518 [Haemaphysalis longicornis]|uniref:Serine/threonine-protein kinase greatwall n=1 Tax=Haemaphysalis longicornis TaxID=44386 RepID=A0A9J6GBX3_HAELO|nr:hypothetical protein HPB48_003518 [Haemaphysalis longicornis]